MIQRRTNILIQHRSNIESTSNLHLCLPHHKVAPSRQAQYKVALFRFPRPASHIGRPLFLTACPEEGMTLSMWHDSLIFQTQKATFEPAEPMTVPVRENRVSKTRQVSCIRAFKANYTKIIATCFRYPRLAPLTAITDIPLMSGIPPSLRYTLTLRNRAIICGTATYESSGNWQ